MGKPSAVKRDGKSGRFMVAGRAKDGVEILVPAARPKNFTYRQIERTVETIKHERAMQRDASTGQFARPASSTR